MISMITAKQIKKIWTKAYEIGITEEQLRDIVKYVSGQDSTRELTRKQGIELIDLMERNRKMPGYLSNSLRKGITLCPKKDKKIIGRFVSFITPGQLSLIESLKKEADWDDEHLMNFIRKIFTKDTLDTLGSNEAGVLITVLRRAKGKRLKEESNVLS